MRKLSPEQVMILVLCIAILVAIVGPLACAQPQAQDTRPSSGASGYLQVDEWISRDRKVRCYVRHDYNEGKVFCVPMSGY